MPTLLLSARQTEDAQRLWKACITEKWQVIRAHDWKVPDISPEEVVVYGEPLFAQRVAQTLGLQLQEPPVDWLPRLPLRWRGREVRLTTLPDAGLGGASAALELPSRGEGFDQLFFVRMDGQHGFVVEEWKDEIC
jgi:hypothetical protein